MTELIIIVIGFFAVCAWVSVALIRANAVDVADHEGALEADLTDYVKSLNKEREQ